MKKDSRIYIAGHRGLAGSALMRSLERSGFGNFVFCSHAELDLKQSPAVDKFFAEQRPEYVFLAAAKVGGILANNTYPCPVGRLRPLLNHRSIWKKSLTFYRPESGT